MRTSRLLTLAIHGCGCRQAPSCSDGPGWRHLSSKKGDLPVPGKSTQQTAALVADLDRSGRNGFVLGFRATGPALVWYRPAAKGWDRIVIEPEYLTIEAGGAVHDIDGDGWPDLVFGGDWQSNCVWWWRNPGKDWKPDALGAAHDQEIGQDPAPRPVHCRFQGYGQAAARLLEPGGQHALRRRYPGQPAAARRVAGRARLHRLRRREPGQVCRGHVELRHRRRRPARDPGGQSHVLVREIRQVAGHPDRRHRRPDLRRPVHQGRQDPAGRHRTRATARARSSGTSARAIPSRRRTGWGTTWWAGR